MTFLRDMHRPDSKFWVADGLVKHLGWPRERFAAARRSAIERDLIRPVRGPRRGQPVEYRFTSKGLHW
jgi:hypothetical protein